MISYRVKWEIDIDAENHFDAAKQAREIQLDINSSATTFDVFEYDSKGDFLKVHTQVDVLSNDGEF